MSGTTPPTNRPLTAEQRYRLYIDESGDHVFRKLDEPPHRYLCLLGVWFRGIEYRSFHDALEQFKQKHIPHSPDEPVILHREDIIQRRRSFWKLRDVTAADAFDRELLQLIGGADFRIVAVVIDKKVLQERYPTPAHPYHLALGFMLQRYCGFLNHVNRCGDVLAESRGGAEDRLLKDSSASVRWASRRIREGVFPRGAMTNKKAPHRGLLALALHGRSTSSCLDYLPLYYS